MKKILFMILGLVLSVISFVLSNNFYNMDKSTYGVIFMALGIVFAIVYAVILSYLILKNINNKNDLKIGFVSLAIYTIIYMIYMIGFNMFSNLDFNIYNILLVLFYMSFLSLVVTTIGIFHFWNTNKKKKRILYFTTISITLILVFLLSSILFKSLPVFIVEAIKFIYFNSIVLIVIYLLTLIFYKILKPLNK